VSNTGQPETKVPANVEQAGDWFSDAPGGDLSLADIFGPNPDAVPPDNAAAQAQLQPEPEQAPQQPPQEEFFLRGKRSVYKTLDEAVKGIDEKDELIERLRTEYQRVTGRDPITGRYVAREPDTPRAPATSGVEDDYLSNPAKFLEDLNQAYISQDGRKYYETHAKFVLSMLRPYLPVVQTAARTTALTQVKERVKDEQFDKFLREELPQVLQENETLATLIQAAESNPALAQHLPNLYETAYYFARGRKLPELVKSAAQPVQQPVQPPRPTLRPGTMPPPPPTTAGGKPFDPNHVDWGDPEQRKAYMKWLESKGVLDVKI